MCCLGGGGNTITLKTLGVCTLTMDSSSDIFDSRFNVFGWEAKIVDKDYLVYCLRGETLWVAWLFCVLWWWMIHSDESRMLLAFVGLSCCEFLVDETYSKDGNNMAVTSMKTIMWWSVLSTNSRHMDNRSGGFMLECYLCVCLGRVETCWKNFDIKLHWSPKRIFILLTGCIWNNRGVEWILWGFTDSSNWFCIVLFMRKEMKTLDA